MPQFERRLYEPSEDARAFDSDEDMENEGSRLPLLIGIALIVLLSFAGVVWLAYTQGVERGRNDTPRVVAAANVASADRKPTPYSKLKIYQSPNANEDVASEDPAPAPAAVAPPDLNASKSTKPAGKPEARTSTLKPAVEAPRSGSSSAKTNTAEPAVQPATGAPRVITPVPAAAKPAKTATAPGAIAPTIKPAPVPAGAKPSALKTPQQTKTPPANAIAKQASAMTAKPRIVKPAKMKTAVAKTIPATAAAKSAPIDLVPPKPATKLAAIGPATPTTTTAPAATPETSAKASAGGYVLQIGSYKSDAEANASWTTYKGAHSSVAGYSSDVRKVELGAKGTWYRLRIGPFASLSEANAACAKLKAQGGNCFPAKQ